MSPRPRKTILLFAGATILMLIVIGFISTLLLKDFEILPASLKSMRSLIKPAGPEVKTSKPTVPLEDFQIASAALESMRPLIEPSGPEVKTLKSIPLRIFTTSAPYEFAQRMAIRATWRCGLKSLIPNSTFTFVLGRAYSEPENVAVAAEARKYRDILQGSFMDSYMNLTLKTYFFIKWAAGQRQASFILKTDTDVFVLPHALSAFLRSLPKEDELRPQFWCYVHRGATVHRDLFNKWRVSYKAYPRHTHPDYCAGMTYLMSGITAAVLNASVRGDHFKVPWEDVLFTGIVAEELGIPRTSIHGFQFQKLSLSLDPCQTKGLLSVHRANTTIMQSLWNKLSQCSTAQLN